MEQSVAFVLGSESSRERKFQGAKVLGTFILGSECSREQKFLGAKVLETFAPLELSLPVPGNESSWERKFHTMELSRKFHTMELSLPVAKVLRSESSIIRSENEIVLTAP